MIARSVITGVVLSAGLLFAGATSTAHAATTPEPSAPTAASVACQGFNVEVVTGDGVRIRTAPSTGSRTVGYAYRGNWMCWQGSPQNGFDYGTVSDGNGVRGTGWVSRTYLRPDA